MTPKIEDFQYELPDELIARHPLPDRDGARMLVVDRAAGQFHDSQFRNFPNHIRPGDCLVLNNTRVIPARLFGQRPGLTGKIEIFLLRALDGDSKRWRALVRPGKKLPVGQTVELSETLSATVTRHLEMGEREIEFSGNVDVQAELERIGHIPLPPYIDRPDDAADRERYQTVFARDPGAAAAPTAGLHFTPEVLSQCAARGAKRAELTLHVGLGTFQPLTDENLRTLTLHREQYAIGEEAARELNAAQRRIAIGTTSVRTLETVRRNADRFAAAQGDTDIFITPGFPFRGTDAMLTNFHLPGSSLMMLVSAFAGHELLMNAYRHAVSSRYRFFSYGDCMLIL